MPADRIDTLVSLCKRRGFVYPSGEIYGGTRSAWDYGPLGVELKDNIRRQWWRAMVRTRDDVVGLDSSVILPRAVWEASGHVEAFVDPLTECQSCHRRFRADHLVESLAAGNHTSPAADPAATDPSTTDLATNDPAATDLASAGPAATDPAATDLSAVVCPTCGTKGAFTQPRMFNGLLTTHLGVVDSDELAGGGPGAGAHFLRPETAQGIFVNFAHVMASARRKPPFGIAQTGKSFRNEITPGNFIFRTREFEQMEMEYFVAPGTDEEWHDYWLTRRWEWYVDLGIDPANLRFAEHPKEKLSHYSKRTVDIEYRFCFGGKEFDELEGIANRTDYDLTTHAHHSGIDLSYYDQDKGERWTPYVIEPSAGLGRSMVAFLLDAYTEDEAPNAKGRLEKRTVLRLDHRLAPVKAAILPLSRNAELSPRAREVAARLRSSWNVDFDDAGAIGRRYRRQDEIGTPYCVTVDFETLEDRCVTVRERDSRLQERVSLDRVEGYLAERLVGC